MSYNLSKIRNFSIISHIDAGKSTLADRFLELTKTVSPNLMKPQYLDRLSLERERGITIKLQPVTMNWQGYTFNLIDTPGHVDFSYEVSRSLAATEGALLLVDARNGLEAQTMANFYLAKSLGLKIIPIVNKIDLVDVDVELRKKELAHLCRVPETDVLCISAKYNQGIVQVLNKIIEKISPPIGKINKPFRALVFDSFFDEFKGVIIYLRVVDGQIKLGQAIKFFSNQVISENKDLGIFKPELKATGQLIAGQIGYLATGLKEISLARIGETVFLAGEKNICPLPGFQPPQPMVFADFYPAEGSDFIKLKKALTKIKLNDPSIVVQQGQLKSLGQGFHLGFLGPLHLEVIAARIKREYQVGLIITPPTTEFRLTMETGEVKIIRSPFEFPEAGIKKVEERLVDVEIIVNQRHYGPVMKFLQVFSEKNLNRFKFGETEYLFSRVVIHFSAPYSLLIHGFYDKLKSNSHGFASYSYKIAGYQQVKVVKIDILIAGKKIEQLSFIVYQDQAFSRARLMVKKLKQILPRQLFEVKIQAAVRGKIIAAERLSAKRKDVTAPLYGGDVSRKKKLLAKQKAGKKKLAGKTGFRLSPEIYKQLFK